MLNNEFKKSATEKLKSMDSNELKNAFKEIGSESETNEEWLKSCNTEQLAEVLCDIRYDYQVPWKNKGVVEWLKQPHNE